MARLLDWQALLDMDTGGNVIIAMSTLQASFLQACSAFYENRYSWVYGANDVTTEQWDAIDAMKADTELSLMGNMVGLILPNVLADVSDIGVLECDGTQYLRVDYPFLYAVISPAFIIDADNFVTPDLRERFPSGASIGVPVGTMGGEEDVLLDETTMPSHSHASTPHSHTESASIPSTVLINAGAPVPTALPSASVTGLATVDILDTGGGLAHNNIPPFLSISYVIVSG